MSFRKVAYASDMGVAMVIYSLLDSEGFDVLDFSNSSHISLAGADQGFYISVYEDQADAAIASLKEHELSTHLLQ